MHPVGERTPQLALSRAFMKDTLPVTTEAVMATNRQSLRFGVLLAAAIFLVVLDLPGPSISAT